MTSAPAPLIPADVDMGQNDYFPLYFERMLKSKWWKRASHLARSINIDLWGRSYREVPAGSLPDDDVELADWCGYGRDVEAFQAAKAEILEPWILCSDGRWYHPTVCEITLETWEKGSVRRKSEAARKREYRARVRHGLIASGDAENGRVPPKSATVPADDPPCPAGHPPLSRGTGPKNVRTVPTKGEEEEEGESPLTPQGAQAGLELDGEEPAPVDEVRVAFDLWNATAEACGLAVALDLTDKRRKAIGARLKVAGLAGWRDALAAIEVSRFCRGLVPPRDGRKEPFRADLDFVLQVTSFQRLREGYYGKDAQPPARPDAARPAPAWSGPAEIWDMAVDERDLAWARSWLGRCRWQDIPRAIVSENGFVVDTINRELGHILRRMGVAVVEQKAA